MPSPAARWRPSRKVRNSRRMCGRFSRPIAGNVMVKPRNSRAGWMPGWRDSCVAVESRDPRSCQGNMPGACSMSVFLPERCPLGRRCFRPKRLPSWHAGSIPVPVRSGPNRRRFPGRAVLPRRNGSTGHSSQSAVRGCPASGDRMVTEISPSVMPRGAGSLLNSWSSVPGAYAVEYSASASSRVGESTSV